MQEIKLSGWKGKGDLAVFKSGEDFLIKEPRKDKLTGEVEFIEKKIPYANVWTLWRILQENCSQDGTFYGYKYIVRKLIEHYKFDAMYGLDIEVMMNCFNGGAFRSKAYFPFYYYPVRILEKQGWITYTGKGGVSLTPTNKFYEEAQKW